MNESKLDVSIRCLVCVYQAAKNQQVEIPLPQKPYNKLKNMGETLVKVLKNIVIVENIDISAFISKFLSKLLQNQHLLSMVIPVKRLGLGNLRKVLQRK